MCHKASLIYSSQVRLPGQKIRVNRVRCVRLCDWCNGSCCSAPGKPWRLTKVWEDLISGPRSYAEETAAALALWPPGRPRWVNCLLLWRYLFCSLFPLICPDITIHQVSLITFKYERSFLHLNSMCDKIIFCRTAMSRLTVDDGIFYFWVNCTFNDGWRLPRKLSFSQHFSWSLSTNCSILAYWDRAPSLLWVCVEMPAIKTPLGGSLWGIIAPFSHLTHLKDPSRSLFPSWFLGERSMSRKADVLFSR